jgi:hypothetical protein
MCRQSVKVNNRKKTKGISWEGRIEVVIELYTLWASENMGPPQSRTMFRIEEGRMMARDGLDGRHLLSWV